jgi:hypothetical protein
MPKAAVRANARPLSKAKSRRGATEMRNAHADWQAACAAYNVASASYLALCAKMDAAARSAAADHSKRLKAIYAEEEKLAIVIDARDNAASTVLAAPASMEALHLKLDLFLHHWAKERDVDQPLDGGDIADVAAGIVLDLLTLLRRGAGLAEIASAA